VWHAEKTTGVTASASGQIHRYGLTKQLAADKPFDRINSGHGLCRQAGWLRQGQHPTPMMKDLENYRKGLHFSSADTNDLLENISSPLDFSQVDPLIGCMCLGNRARPENYTGQTGSGIDAGICAISGGQ
jgi:hypothetical protein